jgi:hypothetical protein
LQDADGVAVLDYGHAQKAARAWWRADLRREEGYDTRAGPFTVADAVSDYLTAFEKIEEWHQGLAEKPALARSKPGKTPNHRKARKALCPSGAVLCRRHDTRAFPDARNRE